MPKLWSAAVITGSLIVTGCKTIDRSPSSAASATESPDACYVTSSPEDDHFIFCTMHAKDGTSLAMLQQDDFENRSNTGMALMWCDISTQDTVVSNTRTLTFNDDFIKSLKFISTDGFQTGKAEMISDSPHAHLEFKQLPAAEVTATKWVWADESCVQR